MKAHNISKKHIKNITLLPVEPVVEIAIKPVIEI